MKAELGVGAGVLVLVGVGAGLWLLSPSKTPAPPEPAATEPVSAPEPTGGTVSDVPEEQLPLPERVARVLARGRAAAGDGAAAAADAELDLLLGELSEGDPIGAAQSLLDPDHEAPIQEVGARVLNAQESPEARAARQRAVADPRLAASARLILLYDVSKRDDEAARTTLWTVVENAEDDPELRAFALDVVGQPAGAAPRVRRLVEATGEAPFVRAWAFRLLAPRLEDGERDALRATLERDPEAAAALTQLGD